MVNKNKKIHALIRKRARQRRLRRSERGNVFFTLFGAVAIVGLLGAGIMATMRGPLSSMVEVQRRTQAQAEMSIAAKLALLESVQAADSGDCDADGFVEPLEHTATAPNPTGGGQLPAAVSSNKLDPWGTEYGYCSWDPGTILSPDPGECTNTRLDGTDDTSETYTIIAVISAGPDRVFQTTCAAAGSVTKAGGSDDIHETYNYAEATSSTGGLWSVKSGDPNVAEIDKKIEVEDGAAFSGDIDLTGTDFGGASAQLQLGARSMLLPTDAAGELPNSACDGVGDAGNANLLRLNTSLASPTIEICDGGNAWVSATAGSNIWQTDGPGGPDEIYYNTDNVGIGTNDPATTLDITGTLNATGATTLGSTLDVTGAVDFDSTFNADGVATLGDTLGVTGATTLSDTLSVTNGTTLLSTLRVDGDVSDNDSAVTVADDLDVTGVYQIDGATILDNNDSATTLLIGQGTTAGSASDYMNIGDAIHADTANKRVGIGFADGYDAGTNFNDTLEVNGTADITGAFNADGATTLGSTLDVDGISDFNAAVNVTSGDLTVTDNLDVNGNADIDGTLESDEYTWNGDDFTPPTCGADEYITWDGDSWECEPDKGTGGGGVTGALNLDDVLAEGNDAGNQDAENFNQIGADEFCNADLSTCTDLTSILGSAIFEQSGIIVRAQSGVGYSTADFVFGSTALIDTTNATEDSRMYFDKSQSAFRAGNVTNTQWDAPGQHSAAFGYETTASGDGSMAWGINNVASNIGATAFGGHWAIGNTASGISSTAFGQQSSATADYATAWGNISDATGAGATAWGNSTTASGSYATAFGTSTIASGNTSTAMGSEAESAGDTSFALGLQTASQTTDPVVSGTRSMALFMDGGVADANSAYDLTGTDLFAIIGGRQLLDATGVEVDTSTGGEQDLELDVEGDIGAINYCDEDGDSCFTASQVGPNNTIWEDTGTLIRPTSGVVDYTTDDFVFGSYQLGDTTTGNEDSRMYFDKSKGAFRAGTVTADHWDDAKVGTYSTAWGINTTASGQNATAMGYWTNATGQSSMAWGQSWFDITASGEGSTAFGVSDTGRITASGSGATAWGYADDAITASGMASTAWGSGAIATAIGSTAWGNNAAASGQYATAFGKDATASGLSSVAIGLQSNSQTTSPVVSGDRSMALFMDGGVADANSAYNLTGDDLFAIIGGRALIDATGVEVDTSTGGERNLDLDVEGDIGAIFYCNEDGDDCFTAADVANNVVPGNDREIFFNNSGVLGTDVNFVFTSAGYMGIGTNAPAAAFEVAGTDSILFPRGTTAQRPGTAVNGMMRYNSDVGKYEAYQGGAWQDILTNAPGNSIDLSSLNAASADNAIANAAWNQVWNWQLTGAETGMTFGESAVSTGGSDDQYIVSASTLAASTAIPLYVQNLGAGRSFQVDDEAADATPFVIDVDGNVGIQEPTPTHALSVGGSILAQNALTNSATLATAEGSLLIGDSGNLFWNLSRNSASDNDLFLIRNFGGSVFTSMVFDRSRTGVGINTSSVSTGGDQDLELDVEGDVGAVNYCDADGNNCFIAADVSGGTIFERNGTVVRGISGNTDYATDDFVFGSHQLADDNTTTDFDSRMFFDKSKSAFRAGIVNGDQWDDAKVGIGSTAWGFNTTASGNYSTAFGDGNVASADQSMAWGGGISSNISSGYSSTAFGINTLASGQDSTAFGISTIASGSESTAFGNTTTATANFATAWGDSADATGVGATAWGDGTTASGQYATALGNQTVASGNYSMAWGETSGFTLTASGTGATAFGIGTTASGDHSTTWGDGTTATATRATAWGNGADATGLGATAWGNNSTASGQYATAWGTGATASGTNSTAFGSGTTASANFATAWGGSSTASGSISTAWGTGQATAEGSTAWGGGVTAGGNYSTAWGLYAETSGFGSTAIGLQGGPQTTPPIVSGDRSMALFFDSGVADANSTYDFASSDQFALVGGEFVIGETQAQGADKGCIRFNETDDELEYSDDCATYTAFGDIGGLASLWERNGIVIRPKSGTVNNATDDFLFGSLTLADTGDANEDSRMFFDKSKSAFRAGYVTGDEWDDAKVGTYSAAWGSNTTASGDYSTAFGDSTTASGESSTAMGKNGIASGDRSTVFGTDTAASGADSTVFGNATTATAQYATAWGNSADATGIGATAWGLNTTASGQYATAFGTTTTASGDESMAWGGWRTYLSGNAPIASGTGSTAFGEETTASGNLSTAFGRLTTATGTQATAWGDNNDATAFSATAWGGDSQANGDYSTAFGRSTTATAQYATAWGNSADATGVGATAWGLNSTASGQYSTAFGGGSVAGGLYSLAGGNGSTASGEGSVALGRSSASGLYSTAAGFRASASGEGAIALGLQGLIVGTDPVVSGDHSMGIFMNDQGGVDVTASEVLALLGGRMVIDPANNATETNVSTGAHHLELDVEGQIGAINYCDEDGNNCFVATDVGGPSGLWEVNANVVRPISGSVVNATDDFLFGSLTLGDTGDTDEDSRMFFDKSKGAFRAGTAPGDEWDDAKVGIASTAWGYSTTASGQYATALGSGSIASGNFSTAMGINTAASGLYSTAMGNATTATADYATAWGNSADATGVGATAWGTDTTASANFATAWGGSSTASGISSTAFGANSNATANFATAWGNGTAATGTGATAWGDNTTASGQYATAAGNFSEASGNFSFAMGDSPVASGLASFAIGDSTTASGGTSVAMGDNTVASGAISTAWGNGAAATGTGATAWGINTTASGQYATAFGADTVASGNYSVALGLGTAAGVNPIVSGANSYGIFMGDQSGVDVTAANTFSLMGGTMALGSVAASTGGEQNLEFDVAGDIGAVNYCDADGNNCFVATDVGGPSGLWEVNANVVRPISGSVVNATDDFLFGSLTLADSGNTDEDSRMYFDKSQSAFRAGFADSTQWDTPGQYSTAFGYNSIATANYATAWGNSADATGAGATAWGNNTTASGNYSTAFGDGTVASGSYSTAMGMNTTASGDWSIAMGESTTASGSYSTAMGFGTVTSGTFSTTMGENSTASGTNSTAIGQEVKATGTVNTFAIGLSDQSNVDGTRPQVSGAGSLGVFMDQADNYDLSATDQLGIIGGELMIDDDADATNRGCVKYDDTNNELTYSDDCVTYTAFGDIGGLASLWERNGIAIRPKSGTVNNATDDFLFGSLTLADTGDTDEDSRMYFDKSQSAFRAGFVQSTEWDTPGQYSTAFGFNSTASGNYSMVWGGLSTATANYATSWGLSANATGVGATAWGNSTTASGNYSTAMGANATASGLLSMAMGSQTLASGNYSIAMGQDITVTGLNSAGLGLGSAAGANPIVSGANSYGIFMGDQTGIDIIAANTLALMGGTMTIGSVVATTGGEQNLEFDVEGDIGAINYCDEDGNDCFAASDIGGPSGLWEVNANVLRPISGSVTNATDDFLFGSLTLADTGDTDEDSRMFFDKSKGAFRAGTQTGNEWNDTNVGSYSVAFGYNTRARENYTMAWGNDTYANRTQSTAWGDGTLADGTTSTAWGTDTVASGNGSTAWGIQTQASGNYSTAWGYKTAASAIYSTAWGSETIALGNSSTAFGREAVASGNYSVALGLGAPAGADPIVSGASSFGIFMGDQAGVDVTAANTFSLMGGTMAIGSVAASTGGEQNLEFDVTGDIGAVNYCDEDGNNCFVATDIGGPSGLWEVNANVVRPISGTVNNATDDFLFGSLTLADSGNTDEDSRMYFDKSQSAFRAGFADSTQWDTPGQYSTAFGYNSIATANYATAWGNSADATGAGATAWGNNTTASGNYSTAFGDGTVASGDYSTAMGMNTTASGAISTAWGNGAAATGTGATAWGSNTTASGQYATASGWLTIASGNYSVAMGEDVTVTGLNSTGLGLGSAAGVNPIVSGANSYGIFMGDQSGVDVTAANTFSLMGGTMALGSVAASTGGEQNLEFDVTGDIGAVNYCDADGNNCFVATDVGGPSGLWEVNANVVRPISGSVVNATDDFLFGSLTLADSGNTDEDSRMYFDKSQSAFRAGFADSTQWDTPGQYSTAFGYNSIATANYATAWGLGADATGVGATAWGQSTTASGNYSTAMGANATASGLLSMAMGMNTTASGLLSMAMGSQTLASGNYSIAMGQDVTVTGLNSAGLGLGSAAGVNPIVSGANSYGIFMGDESGVDVSDSDTMAIMGGEVGIGTVSPDSELHVVGDIRFTGVMIDISDERLKTDIEPLQNTGALLDKIEQIEGYKFRMKDDRKGTIEYGVMAQEIERVFPELVQTKDDEIGTKSVNYLGLIAPMIEATKELKAQNEALEAKLVSNDNQLAALEEKFEARLASLEGDVDGLKVHTGFGVSKAMLGLLSLLAMMSMLGGVVFIRRRETR